MNRCSVDRSVRAVVLTGTGDRAFCAGGDVAEFARSGGNMELLVHAMTGDLHTGISRLAWLRALVSAAVNGVAAGGGLSLAACADLVIASDTAKFTSAYTHIGCRNEHHQGCTGRNQGVRRKTQGQLRWRATGLEPE